MSNISSSLQSELHLTQAASSQLPAAQGTPPPAHNARSSRGLSGTQQAKLLSEIDVVQRNIDVMNEILIENQPGKEEEGIVSLMEVSYYLQELKVNNAVGIEYNYS